MLIIKILEVIGTIAFAVAGALVGINRSMDYYGVIILAIATALGGGLVRDMMIGSIPPFAIREPIYTGMSIVAAILTIIWYKKLIEYNNVIQFFDAIGLAAFTAIGNNVALENGLYSFFVIIVLGVLTGTGGGVIRDVLAQEVPFVFRKEIYACASIAGGIVFIFCNYFFSTLAALYACCIVTFLVRMLSLKYNIHLKVIKKEKNLPSI